LSKAHTNKLHFPENVYYIGGEYNNTIIRRR